MVNFTIDATFSSFVNNSSLGSMAINNLEESGITFFLI